MSGTHAHGHVCLHTRARARAHTHTYTYTHVQRERERERERERDTDSGTEADRTWLATSSFVLDEYGTFRNSVAAAHTRPQCIGRETGREREGASERARERESETARQRQRETERETQETGDRRQETGDRTGQRGKRGDRGDGGDGTEAYLTACVLLWLGCHALAHYLVRPSLPHSLPPSLCRVDTLASRPPSFSVSSRVALRLSVCLCTVHTAEVLCVPG